MGILKSTLTLNLRIFYEMFIISQNYACLYKLVMSSQINAFFVAPFKNFDRNLAF